MRKLTKIIVPISFVMLLFLFLSPDNIGQGQDFGSNWQGEYFNNASFSGSPSFVNIDPAINFTWGDGSPKYKLDTIR